MFQLSNEFFQIPLWIFGVLISVQLLWGIQAEEDSSNDRDAISDPTNTTIRPEGDEVSACECENDTEAAAWLIYVLGRKFENHLKTRLFHLKDILDMINNFDNYVSYPGDYQRAINLIVPVFNTEIKTIEISVGDKE